MNNQVSTTRNQRSSTIQLWIVFCFAILTSLFVLIAAFICTFKGNLPVTLWPSVAGILTALWAPISLMHRASEQRKAAENTAITQSTQNVPQPNPRPVTQVANAKTNQD